MFIEDYIDVDAGFPAVQSRLLSAAEGWLAECADHGELAGADVLLRVGPGGVLAPARRQVRVRTGPWRPRDAGIVVPVEWESVRLRALFPRLEGDLEAAPLGGDRCRLTLSGQYSPPLGQVGASLDRRLLHWVAESTVRTFLAGLAEALEAPEWSPAPAPPAVAEGDPRPAGT